MEFSDGILRFIQVIFAIGLLTPLISIKFPQLHIEQIMNKRKCITSVSHLTRFIFPYLLKSESSETLVSLPKTNKGEQLPPLADETSVSRCMV